MAPKNAKARTEGRSIVGNETPLVEKWLRT
jgi:hypothetical protein